MKAPTHARPPRPTEVVHQWLAEALSPGDLVIDATAGNGHDALKLAGKVAPNGRVMAYDVQPAALEATRERLRAAGLEMVLSLQSVQSIM